MSQSNASNNIYKKYCSVFQQDCSISASQEISNRYHEIKQNNESNILNSSRIASQDNKSSSVNNANLKIVIDKIVDSVTRMESSSSGIQNGKSSIMVNFNTKEFVSFNHFNDDTFEDDDGNVLDDVSQTNEAKADSQWGSDTQFAALVDKEAAILNLVNSKNMAQENIETPHTTKTITSLSSEKTDCANVVIDTNQIYNINSHGENNGSRKLKNVEETELVLSSTVLSDFNSTFCEVTQPTYSQNELDVISNDDFKNGVQNISDQNHHMNQCRDEDIDCAEVVNTTNQKNINSDTENNTSLILKNIEEAELVLSSTILSDFNSPFCEVTQMSDLQNKSNNVLRNNLQNMPIPLQSHGTFLKDVNKLPSHVLFKVPNPVFKSPIRKHRYIDTCFKDDLSHRMIKSDDGDGIFKASASYESIHQISDAASRKEKRVFENIDSDDNTKSLQINAFESVMIDDESLHFEKANDGSQITSSVMDTQDFSIKDLDLIYDQEMKTLNRNCEKPFLVGSSKGLGFTTASNKPIKVSKVALFNAKKVFEGIDNISENIQTSDTSYCIDEQGLKANNVGTIENGNRFSLMETKGKKDISPEDAFTQKEQSTKGMITDLKQCLDSSCSQTLEDQIECDIARTINETYTVENDATDINNASKANTNGSDDILGGSTSTALADNIGKISVELEHWEEFFNCTVESVNNDGETSVDFEKSGSPNRAPIISEEENDDSNALSPVIVSQRSKVKIGHLAKNIFKKQDTRKNYNLDSCDGSLEMSDKIKPTAVNKKLFSSARKLDLLEADGGAKAFVLKDEAMQNIPENNILPGEECLDQIQEDFALMSVLENLSKSCGGFVFASTKSVKVSDAALKKGMAIFEEIDEDANELITFDNNEESVYEGISTASCKTETAILTQHPFNVFEIGDENKIILGKNNYANNANEGSTSNTVELRTVKDIAITVSEKAVVVDMDEDVMAMVEDIDKDVMTMVEDMEEHLKTVEGIGKDAQTVFINSDTKTKTVVPATDVFDEMIPEELMELENNLESTAFNTSINKPITLSETVPTKTGQVLGLEETANELAEQNQTGFHIDANGDNNNLCDKELFKVDFFEQKSSFRGFSLASHKPCGITKKGLDFAKNMFKDDLNKSDLDSVESFENSVKFVEPYQFSKHSNNKNKLQDTISKEAPSRDKDIVSVEKDTNDLFKSYNVLAESTVPITLEKGSTSQISKNSSLSTANNKVIPVLDKAKVRDVIKVVDIETGHMKESTVSNPKLSVFNTGNQNPIHVSNEALAVIRNELFKNDLEIENLDEPTDSYPKFPGFSTCNQKPIHVSKEALDIGRRIFKDVDSKNRNLDEPIVSYPEFTGFSTCNQKPIHISKEALDIGRRIFKDIDSETGNLDEPTISFPKFPGFSTGNQKLIHVSKEALDIGRHIFKDVDLENRNLDEPTASYPEFTGFSTCNQKPIHVSKEALDIGRRIFKDVDSETENLDEPTVAYPKFPGFSTCNQKPILVSKKALAIGRKIFEGLDSETENLVEAKKNSFCEFSAGNEKDVVLQEQALSKANFLIVRKDRYVDSNDGSIKAVTDFEEVADVEVTIPDKPKDSIEEFANKNAIEGYTSNSESKTRKRKRPLSPDRFNTKYNLKTNNSSNFLVENLTQEISESALALMNDEKENFSSNFEKANCSSNTDMDDAPLSPILPCRWTNRAKKTFKVPYKSQINNEDKVSSHVLKKVKYTEKISILEIESKVCLTDQSLNDLKEIKNIDLGDLLNSKLNRGVNKIILSSIKTVNSEVVSEEILNISPDNFDNFIFTNERLDIKAGVKTKDLTVKDLVSLFFEHKDVDSKLIPEGWILNGIKWIIWKLASYERFYGEMFRNVLSASAVLTQLKYRYDKELYKAERPILRKILEMDDAPGRKMILCVSRIIKSPVVISDKTTTTGKIPPAYELEVTDGWYGVLATIDNVLCSYISKNKLQVGTKLIVCGSELLNCGQGKTPLEDISAVRLRLHGNGVRRAPHFSRLGPCSNGAPLRVAVDTLEQGAGPTPTLRIKPIVVYPLQHYEKLPNGSTVTKSDRMETLESSRQQLALQARAEQLYAQAEEEVMSEVQRERSKSRGGQGGPVDSQDSEDIAQQMDMAIDPVEFLNNLSNSQRRKLETVVSERNESIRQQIESRVSELLNGDGETSSTRRVVSMLKVRALVLETVGGRHRVTPVMLTVWKPSDCTEQLLQVKDIVLDMYKAVPTGLKAGEINLSANKTTVFKEITNKKIVDKFSKQMEEYKRTCTSIRDANHPSFAPLFKEVDTVGLIFHIEPSVMDNAKQYVQTVYLADQDMNFVAINFWGGIHKFGFEKCIEIGKILACCNLKYRTASRKRIRNLYASEFSTFTQCPKKAYMQEFLKEFENGMKLNNLKEYAEKCRCFLNDMNNSLSVANISRLQNVSSTSKAGIVFDRSNNSTNGLSKMSLNENSLSGLDFDSTFAENSGVSKSPSDAERRIKRLKMYGEPPLLAALVLNVSSNIKKDFIAPSIDTSLRKENCPENDTNNKNEDHFREEFEYSPPLSLD